MENVKDRLINNNNNNKDNKKKLVAALDCLLEDSDCGAKLFINV